MLNSRNMKNWNSTAFTSEGIEPRRDEICFLMLGNALILFRGLKTLKTLSDLIHEPEAEVKSSIIPMMTTKISIQFQ